MPLWVSALSLFAAVIFNFTAYLYANMWSFFNCLNYKLILPLAISLYIYPKITRYIYANSFSYWYSGLKSIASNNHWACVKEVLDNEPLDIKRKFDCIRFSISLYKSFPFIAFFPLCINVVTLILDQTKQLKQIIDIQNSTITVIVAILTTIIAYYYNSRLVAITSNRIKWVNELRNEMAHFFGMIGYDKNQTNPYESECAIKVVKQYKKKKLKLEEIEYESKFKSISKLELLLNPSEELHRTVIALMRLMHGFSHIKIDQLVYEKLGYRFANPIDKKPIDRLAQAMWPTLADECYVIYATTKSKEPYGFLENDTLISHIFRVATAILKTEWEQVKNVK